MRLIDYLLNALNELTALFGAALVKILGPIGAIATAVKSFFDWKRVREEKRSPNSNDYWENDRSTSNKGFWLIGRVFIIIILLSLGAYAWWLGNRGQVGTGDSAIEIPEQLIESYFSYLGSMQYKDAWEMLDVNERLAMFPNGFQQFTNECRSRPNLQFHKATKITKNNSEAIFSVQTSYVSATGLRKSCLEVKCVVSRKLSEKTWRLNKCDPPPHRSCW